jgi:hypothetical protein
MTPVWLPAARGRAVVHGAWWAVLAALTGTCALFIYGSLDFRPSPVTNRLVECCIAVAALPILLVSMVAGLRTMQWLLLAVWPKPVGIRADAHALTLVLGPFRTRSFDAARLEVRYPFDLADGEDAGFESYLPEEQQLAQFVPRLRHPQTAEPLNRTLLRFAAGDEAVIARALRPIFQRWRAANDSASE